MVRNPFAFIGADWKRYGDVVRYRFATRPAYLVVHPDGVKQVLQENHRNYVKSSDYKILAWLLGEGLLTSEGALWMRQHRLIVPVFHSQRIVEFGATMVDSTLRMLERWDLIASDQCSFDVCDEMMKLTLEIIVRVLLKMELVSEQGREIGNAVTVVNERLGEFDLGTLLPFLPTRANLRSRRAGLLLHRIIGSMIAERRDRPEGADLTRALTTRCALRLGRLRNIPSTVIADAVRARARPPRTLAAPLWRASKARSRRRGRTRSSRNRLGRRWLVRLLTYMLRFV